MALCNHNKSIRTLERKLPNRIKALMGIIELQERDRTLLRQYHQDIPTLHTLVCLELFPVGYRYVQTVFLGEAFECDGLFFELLLSAVPQPGPPSTRRLVLLQAAKLQELIFEQDHVCVTAIPEVTKTGIQNR